MSATKDLNSTAQYKVVDVTVKEPEYSSLTSKPSRKEKLCVDCDRLIVDDNYGVCVETHAHGLNNDKGYLCSRHWTRALNHKQVGFKGKCDQCCWWEIT